MLESENQLSASRAVFAVMLLSALAACARRTTDVAMAKQNPELEHAPSAVAQPLSGVLPTVAATDASQVRVFHGRFMISSIGYSVQRSPDQARYPLPVVENYRVGPANTLSYSAYFMNMPTHLNRNDSIDWSMNETEFELRQAVDTIADELMPLGDEETAPVGAYVIAIRINNRSVSRYVSDRNCRAWSVIDPAFQKMIRAFEHATGRPLDPYKLPTGK
jgi:hypothetical protein